MDKRTERGFVLSGVQHEEPLGSLSLPQYFLDFLSSQAIAAEAVLGQGNIFGSWIESRGDDNPLAATRMGFPRGSYSLNR